MTLVALVPPGAAPRIPRVGLGHVVRVMFPPVFDKIALGRERLVALATLERFLLRVGLQMALEVLPVVDFVAHGAFLREVALAVLLV